MSVKCSARKRGGYRSGGGQCGHNAVVVMAGFSISVGKAKRAKFCGVHAKKHEKLGWTRTTDLVETHEEKLTAAKGLLEQRQGTVNYWGTKVAEAERALAEAKADLDRTVLARNEAEAALKALGGRRGVDHV